MDSSEKMNSIIYMDHVLFKAAAEGNIGPFEKYQTCLDQLLTQDENTILHVYLKNQRREPEFTDFVDIILEMCPLLFQANKKGEIPLHLAARYGHSNVVKVLIDCAKALPTDPESGVTEAKKMLRMTNEEQDTALHVAAQNIQAQVVEILTKEDPEFSYSANVHGETPLYIAVSIAPRWSKVRGKVVDDILGNCISVDYGGPNGRTALHAAGRVGNHGKHLFIVLLVSETARKLLEKEKKLTKTTDENGWSPLHYAAFYGSSGTLKVLLENDASAACIAETEKKRTALHIAAIQGHVGIMKEIVSGCPACCELVDNRGWNALHYAVASKDSKVFEQCLEIPVLARLKTEKDEKGNTPFHLIAALVREQKQWARVFYHYYFDEGKIYALNKQQLSVEDIYEGNFGEIQCWCGSDGEWQWLLDEEDDELKMALAVLETVNNAL
ncbi:protein ACCELERATED CELL DEATH 6 [Populus alba]|uniref:protein ACCELERATED CELL DEATH 6 n=1 Tax=Populus alba TaxID=43335 RepID=UPI003CC7638B